MSQMAYLNNGVEGVPPDHHRLAGSSCRSHRDRIFKVVQVPFEGLRLRVGVEADADGGCVPQTQVLVVHLGLN